MYLHVLLVWTSDGLDDVFDNGLKAIFQFTWYFGIISVRIVQFVIVVVVVDFVVIEKFCFEQIRLSADFEVWTLKQQNT